jgi:hypothetical protein
MNFLFNFNIYFIIIYYEYLDENIITNIELLKKIKEIEKLFFSLYLKWFIFKDSIENLIYSILRFEIEEWKDLDPEALDRLKMKTKRYWLSFGDQNLLNKLVEELEEIYQHGSRLKIASEEETEAVLKEIEEQKKDKELEEILMKKLEIQKILASKSQKENIDNNTILNINQSQNNSDQILNEDNDLYKGEMVVVQVEDEDDNFIFDSDWSKKDRAELFGLLGWQESKIAVAKKKMSNYWDFDIELLYIFKDIYDFSEFYDGSYICLLYKLKYEIETKKKFISSFNLYYILEYIFLLYIYIYFFKSKTYIKDKPYNIDYKWKFLRKNIDNSYIDNSYMKDKLFYYWKQKKFKKIRFMKTFWDNILSLNLYYNTIIGFYEQENITKKKYRKFRRNLDKMKIILLFNIKFSNINSENFILNNKMKNLKTIKNYIVDKNIFNDFKKYFPLKEYLVNNNFVDFHDPKFNDDDLFYYILLSLFKLDNKVANFLNALNDWNLNGFITKINVNKYINTLYTYLHYFEKLDKYLFFNKGPNFLINKNKDLYFYEKIGDKVLKYAITSITSETEIEYDYYFIWLYIIPMMLLLLFYTKHVYYLKNKYFGLTNSIMMEWKLNIIISNNVFYTLKVYLEWITRHFTSIEFRAFNKNFYTELDHQHRLKLLSKADREIVINSIYEYMYNYKYNYYYISKYTSYPGSYYIILWNNLALMFIIYILVYLYINKNFYKYYKNKYYENIQLYNYYNQLNSLLHNKEIENINYNEYKYLMIIYLYYTINKSNIYIHYLSQIKNKIINKKKKWI